ncbi:hypothetical protein TNCV_3817001 [Trichonephila clavipes]|nr:hypothetical protein TNCV_3817001 [Trichonephila clavipes]
MDLVFNWLERRVDGRSERRRAVELLLVKLVPVEQFSYFRVINRHEGGQRVQRVTSSNGEQCELLDFTFDLIQAFAIGEEVVGVPGREFEEGCFGIP